MIDLLSYWPIILAVVGVLGLAARLHWGHEKRIRNLEEVQAVRAVLLAQNIEDHIEIKTGLKDIHIEIVKLTDGVHSLAILVSKRDPKP